jgi:hypothetical protein
MDLVTANKQLTAIIEMLKDAEPSDYVAFDNFYKSIYNKALEGYDIVLASRKLRQDGFFKKLFSKLFYKVFNYLSGIDA